MDKFLKSAITILLCSIFCFAQTDPSTARVKIRTENNEVSFTIPSDFTFQNDVSGFGLLNPRVRNDYVQYRNIQTISAATPNATIFFERYESVDSERALTFFLTFYPNQKYTLRDEDKFKLMSVTHGPTSNSGLCYVASGKYTYLIGYTSRENDDATVTKFLSSINIYGTQLFPSKTLEQNETQVFQINELDPKVVSVIDETAKRNEPSPAKSNDVPVPPPVQPTPQASNASAAPNKIESLVLLLKPRPSYTDKARYSQTQGNVRLRVVFHKTGFVEKISVIEGLDHGLTEMAVQAAKRIRFIPGVRNGVAHTISKQVVYNFTLY